MYRVRIHGRAGQGVVTGANVLAVAGFLEGRHAQSFPSFGSERAGAPVTAYCRLDDKPIRLREPVMEPDAIVIGDPTLLHQVDLFQGLADAGLVVINTTRTLADLGLADLAAEGRRYRFCRVGATEIAQRLVGMPMPNAALLGGFAAASGEIRLESLVAALRARFAGRLAEGNVAAATEGFASARQAREALHA